MVTLTCSTSFSFPFDASLLDLPLAELARLSLEEGQKHSERRANDSSIMLALFYRACRSNDDDAWTALYQQYFSMVASWIRRPYLAYSITLPLLEQEESVESLVNAAFTKLVQSLSAEKIGHFTRLPQLLAYFRLCALGVLADRVKLYLSPKYQTFRNALSWENLSAYEDFLEVPGEPLSEDVIAQVERHYFTAHLWDVVNTCLYNDEERLLLCLSFRQGMKPHEICSAYPEYKTPYNIDNLKRSIFGRLSRSPKLKQFLAEYDVLPLRVQRKEGYKEAS